MRHQEGREEATSDLQTLNLNLEPNEASGLSEVRHSELLTQQGWDYGFWAILDETDVADGIVLIGHQRDLGTEGFQIQRLQVDRVGSPKRADDAESSAFHDGWVYVFGSQHGGKEGPIRPRESWVARFRETDVDPRLERPVVLDVAAHPARCASTTGQSPRSTVVHICAGERRTGDEEAWTTPAGH